METEDEPQSVMHVRTITYSYTKNLGNYTSERLEATATLTEDAIDSYCIDILKRMVRESLGVLEEEGKEPF